MEYILLNTIRAWLSLPLDRRNFGLSGKKTRQKATRKLGRAQSITNTRHELNL